MPQQILKIVPVTFGKKVSYTSTSSTTSANNICTIKTANVEISFSNGVDE